MATGKICCRIRERKRWQEFLAFLKTLRQRWPGEKLHLIMDNFSPHKRAEAQEWAAADNAELVFLPTYSSWLNWIESEFAALRYFALNRTDHHSHGEQDDAIAAYIRWRNQHIDPNATSPSTPRSGCPITCPTLLDEALAAERVVRAHGGRPLMGRDIHRARQCALQRRIQHRTGRSVRTLLSRQYPPR
ncbi:transposase [Nocardia sp. CA-128927]|uniref:transposase n=1 Tax=Nocardia sp. CA-128927 TaxID=3239975 RepID=UPI003D98B3C0